MAQNIAIGLFLAFIAISFAKEYNYATEYGIVNLFSKEKNHISGKLIALNGNFALNFKSKATGDHCELKISDAKSDEIIISYNFHENDDGYMQIGNHLFIEEINAVPGDATKDFALNDLKVTYDMKMLETLSLALGEGVGLLGNQYPSALAIYVAARSLLTPTPTNAFDYTADDCDAPPAAGACNISSIEECTDKPFGPECLGMCGKGLTCWPFMCQDCCFHMGCCLHDMCCTNYGMLSWKCLAVFGFSCENYHLRC